MFKVLRPYRLSSDSVNSRSQPAQVSKIIETKHGKNLMLIFNSKAKIHIKKN